MSARDMTQAAFNTALAKHGIKRVGDGRYSLPSVGTYESTCLRDDVPRRQILAYALHVIERESNARALIVMAREMTRGDRLEAVLDAGVVCHAIVTGPLADGMLPVITNTRRTVFRVSRVRQPTRTWTGPASLLEALQNERVRKVAELAAIDAEIAEASK